MFSVRFRRVGIWLFLIGFIPGVVLGQGGNFFDKIRNLSNPPVILPIEHPPKLWLNVERIIFAEVTGKCADEIVATLRQEFVQRGVTVVDRTHLDTVMQEHGLIKARFVEKETAIKLGKILGGTTLITLDVQRCEDEQTRWQKRHDKGTSHYAKSWTFVKGAVQVIDLETTRIFSVEVFEQDGGETAGPSSDRPQFPSIYPIHDAVLRQAAVEVLKMLFRWEEGVEVPFFDNKKCGLKDVYRRLSVGDYDGAEASAETAVDKCSREKESYQARAHYDLGVIRFLQQDYEDALQSFERAYALDPDSRTRKTVMETQRALEARDRLEGYLGFVATGDTGQALAQAAIDQALEDAEVAEAAEAKGDPRARLKSLKGLFDDGLITQEEYDQKRTEILSEM